MHDAYSFHNQGVYKMEQIKSHLITACLTATIMVCIVFYAQLTGKVFISLDYQEGYEHSDLRVSEVR